MSRRTRSPNYPALPLRESIDRAKALYQKAKTARIHPEDAVQTWGYSSVNGASARVLSSLRQYGLLDDVDGDVKLSGRAITIILEPEGSEEFVSAISAASDEPAIFREIADEFVDGLPPENTLVSYLVRKRGFAEDGARRLSAVLRDTIAFAEEHDALRAEERGEEHPPVVDTHQLGVERATAPEHPVTNRLQERQPPPAAVVMEYAFSLPNGRATLTYSGEELTEEDVEILAAYLKITTDRTMLKVATRASASSPLNEGASAGGDASEV